MVMRAYGIPEDSNLTDHFSDAGSTYYTGYLAAAKRLGISNGVGDNLFAPNKAITRQGMFTLYNTRKAIDRLPTGDNGQRQQRTAQSNEYDDPRTAGAGTIQLAVQVET